MCSKGQGQTSSAPWVCNVYPVLYVQAHVQHMYPALYTTWKFSMCVCVSVCVVYETCRQPDGAEHSVGVVGPLKQPVLVGWGHLTRDRRQSEAADQTVFCLTGGDKETVSLTSEQSSPSPVCSTSAPLPASTAEVNQKVGKLKWTSAMLKNDATLYWVLKWD